MMMHLLAPAAPRRWLTRGAVALAAMACAAGASAQSFLANKKFEPSDVSAHGTTTLTFDLLNATDGNLTATLTDTLPATNPVGQLWFDASGTAAVVPGSATGTCTLGTVTYSDFFDAAETQARTITITGAVVPPRPGGTQQPNCQITVPVRTGGVNSDENVINQVPGSKATATNAGGTIYESEDFSATLRIRAPVNPLPTSKAFTPALVVGGGTSTLTIRVRNNTSNPAETLSGVSFTDTLPTGLIAGTPSYSPECGSPSGSGGATVQMSGATIAPGQTCVVTAQVTAPVTNEALVNTIDQGGVTATGGHRNAVAAQATLNVRSQIKMTKAFGQAGSTSDWRTQELPEPPSLYNVAPDTFSFTQAAATASVNQPVAVRVFFSNPTTAALTGGSMTDSLPGSTVAVGGPVTGTCGSLPATPITAGASVVSFSGFTVPAAAGGQPGSCYVQFYVKTTGATSAAINQLSAGAAGNVSFQGVDANVFPDQSTSAHLTTTAQGPGPGDGYLRPTKHFITQSGAWHTGDQASQVARVDKGERFWMRVAVTNTTFDVNYENGSIIDVLPRGLKVDTTESVRIMRNPPAPYGNGADIATPHGCPALGSVAVDTVDVAGDTHQRITYSGWALDNAAPPNNTSPQNLGCFYNIPLVSDDTLAPEGSDSINTIKQDEVTANVEGTARGVMANGDVAARVIVRSDLDTSKSFAPSTIGLGEGAVTRLTIVFDNKSASPITELAVTDPLPSSAGFGTLLVADPASPSNTCGGTLTATPGESSVSLSGGTVPGAGSCQIEVDVQRTGGAVGNASITNSIPAGAVTNAQGQSNLEPVTATLAKSGALGINVVKSFAESSALGGRAVPLTLDFAATTGSNGPQDQITLTDHLPAGMEVAPNPNLTTTCVKADGTTPADVSIPVDRSSFTISGFYFDEYTDGAVPHNRCSVTLSMVLTQTGNRTNEIPAGAITTDVFSTNSSSTQATLSAQPNTALQKQFEPSSVPAGQISTLTLTIVNVNTEPRTDFELTDTFPAGMTVAGAGSTTCGDGVVTGAVGSGSIAITGGDVDANASCTITVPVRAAAEGTYLNDRSNITATNYIDTTETTDELDVGPPPPAPAAIPTLSQWALMLLALLMAGFALRRRG